MCIYTVRYESAVVIATGISSGVPGHSVISNLCQSFLFFSKLKIRVYRTILVQIEEKLVCPLANPIVVEREHTHNLSALHISSEQLVLLPTQM